MQIIGQQLEQAFTDLDIPAVKLHETPAHGLKDPFQVWELTEDQLEQLNKVTPEEWQQNWGWWRHGGCIYEGQATVDYTVNGHPMKGYKSHHDDSDEEDSFFTFTYLHFNDFMNSAMDLSTHYNFAYFAHSLAKDNGLTLAEFMERYEG